MPPEGQSGTAVVDDEKKIKAGAAGQQGSESDTDDKGEGGDALDESKWDDKTAAYIKKLRSEAASNRTKAKGLESKVTTLAEKEKKLKAALGIDEDADPEEKLKLSEAEKQNLTFRNAILETAVANGIGEDDLDYFEFMVSKRASDLKEGEELSDEVLAEIVKGVRAKSKGKANSSVNGGNSGSGGVQSPNPTGAGEVTLDQFVSMNISQKSALYGKDPEKYKQLLAEAKRTKRLI